MTSNNDSQRSDHGERLVRETLRTAGLLVAACVIFVGVLSALAVAITSRAVDTGAPLTSERGAHDTNQTAKKPLSI